MNKKKCQLIFDKLADSIENPVTELKFNDGFELLIAVVLSAQATDIQVNKVTSKLFQVANTPESILNLKEDGLKEFIKSIGLFNSKAKNIVLLCQKLIEDYNSEIPSNFDDLVKLPGVGKKTAAVVLNTLFDQERIAVDTHVFRVSNRIGLVKTKTPDKTEDKLLKIVPKEHIVAAHHLLILHGRYVCKARKPNCKNCVILDECEYKIKNMA